MTRLFGRFLRRSRAGTGPVLDAVAVLLAVWQCWGSRHGLDPDGVSYLDLGASWLAGDWDAAWNPYWSPLYAWLLGVAEWVVGPSPTALAPLVHAVNISVFVFALAAFRFLLSRLAPVESLGWAWRCAAYGLFLEATLGRISLARTTPDLLLAGLLFLAAGLALERRGFVLGAALGACYLAKAAALPLAVVMVLVAGRSRRFIGRAAAGFALVAGWWIVGLSISEGRLTMGDAGKLNYAWNVLGVERPYYPDTAGKVFDEPAAYSFGEPFQVVYPPHFAPGHWYRGLELWWGGEKQWERLKLSLSKTAGLVFGPHWVLLVSLAWARLRPPSRLWVFALAGLALYQPVFVAERYVAAFVALMWLSLLAGAGLRTRRSQVAALIFLALVVVRLRPERAPSPTPGEIAESMLEAGVRSGDSVAAVWPGQPYRWARAAGVRVVAETRDTDGVFWEMGEEERGKLVRAFWAAGAEWVVAPCPNFDVPGWERAAASGYCVLQR